MTSETKIVGRLIPAVESRMADTSVGAISSVPAVNAVVKAYTVSATCMALIDTGAELSLLDQSVFDRLGEHSSLTHSRVVASGLSKKVLRMYNLDVDLIGIESNEPLRFERVPIVVTDLSRPIMMLGRQGLLESLRVEIDFPRGIVQLLRTQRLADRYPALSKYLPGFERVAQIMDSHGLVQGIVLLAMELERFLDSLLVADDFIALDLKAKPLTRRTLREKFLLVSEQYPSLSLSKQIDQLVHTRNIAAHSPGDAVTHLSRSEFLDAAEEIVFRLASAERRPQKGSHRTLGRGKRQ